MGKPNEELKEVTIHFRKGEQEAKMKLSQVNAENQLALIDGVFKFFDIHVDFKEMAAIYQRSGKAYADFFNQLDSEESSDKKVETTEEELATQENQNYMTTGIKIINGEKHYKCRYKCPKCGKIANRYIKENERAVECYDCYAKMFVRQACSEGKLIPDSYGNFFIAGDLVTDQFNFKADSDYSIDRHLPNEVHHT